MDPVDQGVNMLKSFGKQAKLGAHKLKTELQTHGYVKGGPSSLVSECNPRHYRVVAPQGAMMRKGIELDSDQVQGLKFGDEVIVVEVQARRARISQVISGQKSRFTEGWVSLNTNDGERILKQLRTPELGIQKAALEKKFEERKIENSKNAPKKETSISTSRFDFSDSESEGETDLI